MEVLLRLYGKKYKDIPEKDKLAFSYLLGKGEVAENIYKEIENVVGVRYFGGQVDVDVDLLKKFNLSEMKSRKLIPLKIEGRELIFATSELVDRRLRNFAEEYARMVDKNLSINIKYFKLNFELEDLLERKYKGISESIELSELGESESLAVVGSKMIFEVERVADKILEKAFENRASDIHIEPLREGFHVRYRVDGHLSIIEPYAVEERQYKELVNRIKIMAELNIAERRRGQDGSIKDRVYRGKKYDLRLSTISGVLGEKVVIRVLERGVVVPSLEELGFSRFYINAIRSDMERHNGLILNTGSVGSGKSTTQSTLLSGLDGKSQNIYSIEDPVERTVDYVNHICVKETNVSYEEHLETLLRQDPDVIAIGEIRNLATMDMALKASLSGQLVFATMHTNSAIEAFYRLLNMGVEPYELGAALVGVGSQRLVRTLCPYCKKKRIASEVDKKIVLGMLRGYDQYRDFNIDKFEYLYENGGCSHCNFTGYKGRTAVAEYLSSNDEIREYISEGMVVREKLIELAGNSFLPIEVDALNKVLLGKTTLEEIIKEI